MKRAIAGWLLGLVTVVLTVQLALAPAGYCVDGVTGGECITIAWWHDATRRLQVAGLSLAAAALFVVATRLWLRRHR